jgi:transcription termination factor Rho
MREKYEALPVAELRKIAKEQGIHGVSSLRKAELIDRLMVHGEAPAKAHPAPEEKPAGEKAPEEKPAVEKAMEAKPAAVTPAADKDPEAKPAAKIPDRGDNAAAEADEAKPAETGKSDRPARGTREISGRAARAGRPAARTGREGRPQTRQQGIARNTGSGTRTSQGIVRGTRNAQAGGTAVRNGQGEGSAALRNPQGTGSSAVGNSKSAGGMASRNAMGAGGAAGRNAQNGRTGMRNRTMPARERMESRNERQDGRSERPVRQENRYERNERQENRYERNDRQERQENRFERQESRQERTDRGERNDRQEVIPAASEYQQETERQNQYARTHSSQDEGGNQGQDAEHERMDLAELDSGLEAYGILEVMQDGFGFIRSQNFLPGDNDVYVAPSQIRRFNLKTGDMVRGNRKIKSPMEKFAALLYITSVNGYPASAIPKRPAFENLTPVFPNSRIKLEQPAILGNNSHQMANITALRVMDLLSPIGKGQRGMIVSPPKAGKTTLLKQVAEAVTKGYPDMHLIILLIDERPEEVTDIREAITGPEVEVIYSTFDELPERHKRVSEMTIEHAKRLVEHGRDVMILLDSMTRLARAYNLVEPPSGRTLSGGLDPAALHMPKRFFGAARNMREGGSLTILATALIETGSRMDDVIYEEFKGTGNMEIVLDRKLSEKRIFPAIDILRSGTRRDDLLLSRDEQEVAEMIHKATSNSRPEESVERILDLFAHTRSNADFIRLAKLKRMF